MAREQLDKDGLVGHILIELPINKLCKDMGRSTALDKTLALERYMRAYLRSLTVPELEFELKWIDDNGAPSLTTIGALVKAASGYDAFVARRKAKVRV